MQEDPFAAFKPSESPIEKIPVEKKKRGRKKQHAMEQAQEGTRRGVREAMGMKESINDALETFSKIVLILTPFNRKDQERILKAVGAVMDRP